MLDIAPIFISVGALLVAYFALQNSKNTLKAALHEPRMDVYIDTQNFVRAWIQDGKPDLSKLPMLVRAWERSQYLFSDKITKHIKKIWTDAVRAQYLIDIQDSPPNTYKGDPIKERYELLMSHSNLEQLLEIFKIEMKIQTSTDVFAIEPI